MYPENLQKGRFAGLISTVLVNAFLLMADMQVNYMTDLVYKNVFLLPQYRFIPLHLYFHPC